MTKPIPVKLSVEILERLDHAASVTGLQNRSALIRLCLQSFLDYFEQHGEMTLPLEWQTVALANQKTLEKEPNSSRIQTAAEDRRAYKTRKDSKELSN